MKNIGFSEILDGYKEFEEILNSIKSGLTPAHINGVSESSVSHLVFCACRKLSKNALVIAPDGITANRIHQDMQLFYGERAFLFREKELIFYDIDASANDVKVSRLSVLSGMLTDEPYVVVATVSALLSATAPKERFGSSLLSFKVGQEVDTASVAERFVSLGYTREEVVEGRGQFSIRGGIIDFYPPSSENPYRIELFDTEIDSIREFDAFSQRSVTKTDSVSLMPASEIMLDGDCRDMLIEKLEKYADTVDEVVSKTVRHDIEKLKNGLSFPAIDKYIPLIYKDIPTVIDYLDDDGLVFMCEPKRVGESADSGEWQLGENVAGYKEKGLIPNIEGQWRLSYVDALSRLEKMNFLSLAALSDAVPGIKLKTLTKLTTKPQTAFHGKIDFFYDAVKNYRNNKYKVLIFAGNAQKAANIAHALNDIEIEAVYMDEIIKPPEKGQIIVTRGALNSGYEFPAVKTAVISDKEIFGSDKKPKRRQVRNNHERIRSYADLNVGDYVVHQNHGIGQFAGIKTMTVNGAVGDYLQIKFNGNDKLYVPTNSLDLLYKYIGKEGASLKLNRLNSTQWQQTKLKVKKSCEDMAEQLIGLYASRQKIEGISFSSDGDWHSNFAATFPYEETDDQLRAIDDVRRDMEKKVPMDRLLCGDVGYGKTEVALRAAFKAVTDGYQVAYLVPTTILANQIYHTFCDRLKDFPVKVEMLSRFRSVKQRRQTVENAKKGETDIVIGTHRIIQKDVDFKKLGLVIIDEEQRFGVGHKEKLKELQNSVDVLTLSATPIPRTLHMGMIGIRDISVLENPPKDRYPVSTYVFEYNEEIIKEAVLNEVSRGGQVYYLHNKVQTIEKTAERIRSFSPGLRVATGHGKMSESALENVMQQVLEKEVDVLVCTTIIETGLDIPNVNTIIVEDADKMGLAQLYQLRGRVGRSNRMAYAYLVYKRDKVLTEIAEKRLRAIRDFTEFGSGFKIALRDLEIRGAGNLVGAQQHGHMDAVGYDMYCRLLAEAVAEIKGEPSSPDIQTVVMLTVNAFIPKDYIEGENYRIEIYKKIASVADIQDAYDVYEEIEDRYGTVPETVSNLIDIALIRSLAAKCGIEEVAQKPEGITFTFSQEYKFNFERFSLLMERFKGQLLFTPVHKPYFTMRFKGINPLENIKNILHVYKSLHDSGD